VTPYVTLYAAFAGAAERHPDRPAVLGDQTTLRYRQLRTAAAGIAAALDTAGGGAGSRVGLLLEHGVSTVAAILGALRAGRCYVPLDPSWPRARLAYMCSHAGVSAVLTSPTHRALAAELAAAPAVLVDDLGQVLGAEPAASSPSSPASSGAAAAVGPDDPAYILYTSGSTGRPKGVVQSHRNVLHGAGNHVANLGITPDDRISLLSSFSFDMAVTDMYSAVLHGAAVVTVDIRRHGFGHLVNALARRRVTVYHSTPTVYRYLIDALSSAGTRLPALRAVVLGGEEVTRGDVLAARRHFADDCVLVNGYGATEVSFAVQYHIRPGERPPPQGPVPIGYPLAGYEVVLSEDGEIAIRGDHLALGYWRDPQRTAERFLRDAQGRRLYRTGDLGRLLPDGRLVYLGRRDRQVKVRGYRVELGEVEAHLEALPGVARAVAVARPNRAGIAAYLQPSVAARQPLDTAQVRRALRERLPDYLVPGAIVVCEQLPLTPTGKVDVPALPDPTRSPAAHDTADTADTANTADTATERVVLDAWCAALGVPNVGVTENFFDLGGHSLMLTRVQQKIEAELGIQVPLIALLVHPTVRAQAGYLDDQGNRTVRGLDAVSHRMARRRASRAQREARS
jgi:amino acid adenylation domain-containing protein